MVTQHKNLRLVKICKWRLAMVHNIVNALDGKFYVEYVLSQVKKKNQGLTLLVKSCTIFRLLLCSRPSLNI